MTTPEPRTWAIPPEPEDVERVRDEAGRTWKRDDEGAWRCETSPLPDPRLWANLLPRGPLTEVVETEVEAAARRLRECEFDKRGTVRLSRDYANAAQDIHVVLVHVLNGGAL